MSLEKKSFEDGSKPCPNPNCRHEMRGIASETGIKISDGELPSLCGNCGEMIIICSSNNILTLRRAVTKDLDRLNPKDLIDIINKQMLIFLSR